MNITKSKNITNGETSSFLLNIKKYKYFYILLLPAILYTFIFNYLPLGGVIMAFQDFDIIKGFSGSEWVGLDNFIKIFTMPNFLLAIKNTFIYSGTILFLGFPLPIILALLFNELRNLRFKKVVQTISYMPYFLSWASVVALFYGFFAINGYFNDMRVWLFGEGIERINIFMDAGNFLKIIFFSHVWKNVGWNSVIFLASIAAISPSLYEAAIVDGCGRFKQIWYITLPSLLPTAIIILILNTGSLIVSNFEQVYGLQNLFIQEQTEVINTLVYRQGLNIGNYSLATAFGLTQGIVSFLIVFVVNKIAKNFLVFQYGKGEGNMIKVKKKVNGSSVFDVFNIVFMILLCVVTVYPFLNQLALSLNTGSNASFGGVTIFPREFTMDNFKTLITNPSIKDAIIVSVTRVIAGTAIGLVVTTSAAYAMTCRKLPGKSVFIWFLLLPMFINAGIIPNFILFRKLHLINNFLVYIIPGSFVFYNMIIIRTFMQGIPKSLEESAYLDGANEIQILFKVILPLCKPVMATICLWVAVGHWNDWMSNLLYITKNHLNTLQYILLKVVKESEMTQSISETAALTGKAVAKPTPETVRAATIVLTTLPIIMLYPFLQKYFVKGVTIGAIKE